MKYLPWDRLQIDDTLYNHAPVRKAEVVYPLYKGFHSMFAHVPYYHRNLSIYTATHDDKIDVLQNFAQDNDPVQRFATVALFDFTDTLQETGEALEAQQRGFEYHPYHASFETLLTDLLILRDSIRQQSRAAGLVQSYHRRIYTILLHLDAPQVAELRTTPILQQMLHDFMTNSADENLYGVMLTNSIILEEAAFFEMFDQAAFLGEEHMDFALDFFTHLDEGNISMMQEHIGWGTRKNSARFTSLHPRKYTPSQWVREREAAIAAEEEAYAKFLASLSED